MLTGRLSGKSESGLFGSRRTIVDDQVVARGLTMKVTVHGAWYQQLFALAARLQLFENRAHMFGHKRLVLFCGFPSLLELPLAIQERRLIDISENVAQRNVLHDARAEKRWLRNGNFLGDVRSSCVRRVAGDLRCAARSQRFLEAELCVLANKILIVG